jgi:hypothetical protein
MIYKFRSTATGDLIMMGPVGDQMLRIVGKEPSAKGILEAAALPAAIAALEAAVAVDEAARAQGRGSDDEDAEADGRGGGSNKVSLRQRAWPLVEMMRRAQREQADIVWGV